MMPYYGLFYSGILLVGILSSVSDIRHRIIKNEYILFGLSYGICVYLFLFYKGRLDKSISFLLLNVFLSIAIAYFLYLKNLWKAGDAKLFIVLSLLSPFFRYCPLFRLPTITLFINISVLSLFYIFIVDFKKILSRIKCPEIAQLKKEFLHFSYALSVVFSISWIIRFLLQKITILDTFFSLIFLFAGYSLVFGLVEKLKSKKIVFFLILFLGIMVRFFLQPEFFFSPGNIYFYMISTLKYTVLFSLLNFCFQEIAKAQDNKLELHLKEHFAFAPVMFFGALLMESPLISFVLKMFTFIRS